MNNRVRVVRVSPGERILIVGTRRRNHKRNHCRRCSRR